MYTQSLRAGERRLSQFKKKNNPTTKVRGQNAHLSQCNASTSSKRRALRLPSQVGRSPQHSAREGGCRTLLSSRSSPRRSKLEVCWPALAMRLGQHGSPKFFRLRLFIRGIRQKKSKHNDRQREKIALLGENNNLIFSPSCVFFKQKFNQLFLHT